MKNNIDIKILNMYLNMDIYDEKVELVTEYNMTLTDVCYSQIGHFNQFDKIPNDTKLFIENIGDTSSLLIVEKRYDTISKIYFRMEILDISKSDKESDKVEIKLKHTQNISLYDLSINLNDDVTIEGDIVKDLFKSYKNNMLSLKNDYLSFKTLVITEDLNFKKYGTLDINRSKIKILRLGEKNVPQFDIVAGEYIKNLIKTMESSKTGLIFNEDNIGDMIECNIFNSYLDFSKYYDDCFGDKNHYNYKIGMEILKRCNIILNEINRIPKDELNSDLYDDYGRYCKDLKEYLPKDIFIIKHSIISDGNIVDKSGYEYLFFSLSRITNNKDKSFFTIIENIFNDTKNVSDEQIRNRCCQIKFNPEIYLICIHSLLDKILYSYCVDNNTNTYVNNIENIIDYSRLESNFKINTNTISRFMINAIGPLITTIDNKDILYSLYDQINISLPSLQNIDILVLNEMVLDVKSFRGDVGLAKMEKDHRVDDILKNIRVIKEKYGCHITINEKCLGIMLSLVMDMVVSYKYNTYLKELETKEKYDFSFLNKKFNILNDVFFMNYYSEIGGTSPINMYSSLYSKVNDLSLLKYKFTFKSKLIMENKEIVEFDLNLDFVFLDNILDKILNSNPELSEKYKIFKSFIKLEGHLINYYSTELIDEKIDIEKQKLEYILSEIKNKIGW